MNEEEMRLQEAVYNTTAPGETYLVLRLDGRAFTNLTSAHYAKPFDERFYEQMIVAAKALMADFDAIGAYVGSDEISVVLSPTWEQFDRRVQKLVSISSGIVSGAFSLACGKMAQFDSRLLTFETMSDVLEYLNLRQMDVRKNALSTALYWTLRKKHSAVKATSLTVGKNGREQAALLLEQGIDFEDFPAWAKNGSILLWSTYQKQGFNPITQMTVMAERREIRAYPLFDKDEKTGRFSELEKTALLRA